MGISKHEPMIESERRYTLNEGTHTFPHSVDRFRLPFDGHFISGIKSSLTSIAMSVHYFGSKLSCYIRATEKNNSFVSLRHFVQILCTNAIVECLPSDGVRLQTWVFATSVYAGERRGGQVISFRGECQCRDLLRVVLPPPTSSPHRDCGKTNKSIERDARRHVALGYPCSRLGAQKRKDVFPLYFLYVKPCDSRLALMQFLEKIAILHRIPLKMGCTLMCPKIP